MSTAVNVLRPRNLIMIFSMRFRSRLLPENQDQRDDHHQERERRSVTAEGQPALRVWLVEKVADDGAERARQNERGPKQDDVWNAREVVKESGQGECTTETAAAPR
jgi:hypothetical protein